MTRVELTDGAWADIRPASSIKAKDRKKVLLSLDGVEGAMAQVLEMGEVVMALAVVAWSLDLPLPSDSLASLGEMSIPDYDLLSAAVTDYHDVLFPDFDVKKKDGALDPKATSTS